MVLSSSLSGQPMMVTTIMVGGLLGAQLFTQANPIGRCYTFFVQLATQEKSLTSSKSIQNGIDDYSKLHREQSVEERNENYKSLVNAYYDLATVFYEYGWGSSFHFSYQFPNENFYESIRRHEYQLASQLRVYGSTNHVLDVGCGIGGPMRNIAKFLQVKITGITLNPYQVMRGNELTKKDKNATGLCTSIQGDFMNLPFGEDHFDAIYAIEATCHAPDRVKCYSEIYRTLKPGAIFACYEWCMTDKYDPSNPSHLKMKKDIEEGNGLPDIITTKKCLQALQEAGFELLTESDLADNPKDVTPWYTAFIPLWNPFSQRFQFTWLGIPLSDFMIRLLELVFIAPRGTFKTQKVLQTGAIALRDAGQAGIFTTMYLMVGRKPSNK